MSPTDNISTFGIPKLRTVHGWHSTFPTGAWLALSPSLVVVLKILGCFVYLLEIVNWLRAIEGTGFELS